MCPNHAVGAAGRPLVVETVDDSMARVLAQKSGVERLAIAAGMFRSARRMIEHHLCAEHPDWDLAQVQAETARRLADGAG